MARDTGVPIGAQFTHCYDEFVLDVDLALPAKGVTVLYGQSGSGKTTLLRCLAGLVHAPGGTLRVGGDHWQGDEVFLPTHKRPIGYVFQEPSLFEHLTVAGNLSYAQKRVDLADSSRSALSSEEVIALLGIENLLQRKPNQLSGGEKQRVAIARALFSQPELLLMDEPLASLDTQRKREILPYLEKLRHELEIPIIYVTHSIDELSRLADWVVVLDKGRVVADGSLADVLTALDSPLQLDDAGVVLETTILSREAQWALMRVGFSGGELLLADNGRAEGETLRVRVDARDVSLTLSQHTDTSILNALPATVIEISACLSQGAVLVKLGLGHQSIAALDESKVIDEQSEASRDSSEMLLSRITRRSADYLELAVGSQVWAQIKSVAVLR
jgi:molybdate transport system ATP-binding protein